MAFFDLMKEMITEKPAHLKSPHFYKENSDAEKQLEKLKECLASSSEESKKQIELDIKLLTYGIEGEKTVAYELKNSYLPIIVLHDLYYESDGLTAQIDYLVITTKFTLVIECKNLFGNIEVNSNGDFIRSIEYGGHTRKEGIYNPIAQNIRHLEMIRKVRGSSKDNFLNKAYFEKHFDDNYKSVVVLANPKTIINMKYAKKEIKDQIIRSDQLIAYIKNLIKSSPVETMFEKNMYELADFFNALHKPNPTDYCQKYIQEVVLPVIMSTNVEDTLLYKELKQYRAETSKAEGNQAYVVFKNDHLEDLISKMPRSIEELANISGFGPTRIQKYGKAILEIINRY